ncbi:MAG: hypothetical protein Q8R66_05245 [Methanobacteriaceae archaeon]|nr:hypothetical protein [Methanobacteriaceae archaeon]
MATEDVVNASKTIKNPINPKIAILRKGMDKSRINVNNKVIKAIEFTALSHPKSLASITDMIIKIMALKACFHCGAPVGRDNNLNLSEKPFF